MEAGQYEERRVRAILDLGSNSLRLLVIRINPDRTASVMAHLKQMVRLGEGAFAVGRLQPEPMLRTLRALIEFRERCDFLGVNGHIAYATAAVRDAENGRNFLEKIREKTGFDFKIISGEEEARLIGLGASSALPPVNGRRMIVDIGGGSTEMVIVRGRTAEAAGSVKVGAVRLAELFPECSGKVSGEVYRSMKEFVRESIAPAIKGFERYSPVELVGSSGSAKCLARIEAAENVPTEDVRPFSGVTFEWLQKKAKELCGMDEETRSRIPGMIARRAGIIIPGAAILETVMELSGFPRIRYSDRGLREGMMIEYLERLK